MTQAALLPTRARDQCGTLLILSSKSSRQDTAYAANLHRLSIVALEKATNYLLPGLSLVTRLELLAQLLQKTLRPGNNVTTVPTTPMWQTSPGFNPLGAIWFLYMGHVLLYSKRTVASSVTVRLRGSYGEDQFDSG